MNLFVHSIAAGKNTSSLATKTTTINDLKSNWEKMNSTKQPKICVLKYKFNEII